MIGDWRQRVSSCRTDVKRPNLDIVLFMWFMVLLGPLTAETVLSWETFFCLQNKRNISKISAKYIWGVQVFPLNIVKCVSKSSCKFLRYKLALACLCLLCLLPVMVVMSFSLITCPSKHTPPFSPEVNQSCDPHSSHPPTCKLQEEFFSHTLAIYLYIDPSKHLGGFSNLDDDGNAARLSTSSYVLRPQHLQSSSCGGPPLYWLLPHRDDTSLSLVSAADSLNSIFLSFLTPRQNVKASPRCNYSQVLLREHERGENTLLILQSHPVPPLLPPIPPPPPWISSLHQDVMNVCKRVCVCVFGLTSSSFNSGERRAANNESDRRAATGDGGTAHPSLAVFSPTPDENTNKQSIVFSHSLGPR